MAPIVKVLFLKQRKILPVRACKNIYSQITSLSEEKNATLIKSEFNSDKDRLQSSVLCPLCASESSGLERAFREQRAEVPPWVILIQVVRGWTQKLKKCKVYLDVQSGLRIMDQN